MLTVTLNVSGQRGEGKTTLINKLRPIIIGELAQLGEGKLRCQESQSELVRGKETLNPYQTEEFSIAVKRGWEKRRLNAKREGWNPAKGRKSKV